MSNHTLLIRSAVALTVPAVAAALLLGARPAGSAYADTSASAAQTRASFDRAATSRITQTQQLAIVDAALRRISAGERELAESQGKVLSGTSRARLTSALQRAATATAATEQQLVAQRRIADTIKANPAASVIYVLAPGLFSTSHPAAAESVPAALHDLDTAQKATSDDVKAWNIQNTIRINQQKAAAAAAAATAAAATRAATSRTSTPGVYTEDVWASGFQTQLDACRGGVNLSAAYGVATIGEVWGCGGARFPRAGGEVRLTGIMGGLYRVGPVVATLDAYTDNPSDIPRGYALLYQTCLNGNASTETFTELIPIG